MTQATTHQHPRLHFNILHLSAVDSSVVSISDCEPQRQFVRPRVLRARGKEGPYCMELCQIPLPRGKLWQSRSQGPVCLPCTHLITLIYPVIHPSAKTFGWLIVFVRAAQLRTLYSLVSRSEGILPSKKQNAHTNSRVTHDLWVEDFQGGLRLNWHSTSWGLVWKVHMAHLLLPLLLSLPLSGIRQWLIENRHIFSHWWQLVNKHCFSFRESPNMEGTLVFPILLTLVSVKRLYIVIYVLCLSTPRSWTVHSCSYQSLHTQRHEEDMEPPHGCQAQT